MELAPIAMFVYNRPEHARRTLESLRENDLARSSDLFVFSDGPKTPAAAAEVREVREFVRRIDGFKNVTIVERERNWGLANSAIAGVSQLCEERGRAIAVEDDLLMSPDFLTFMNQALDRYQDEPRIFSVGGFSFPIAAPASYPYDAFCSYRSIPWGWGTWKGRWQKADWTLSDYTAFRADKQQQRLSNRGGEDLCRMLALQMAGRIDSWSIRWDYTHFKHEAWALLPARSRILNISLDGSGVHCSSRSARQSPLGPKRESETRFPSKVNPDLRFAGQIYGAHRVSVAKRCAQFMHRWMKDATKRSRAAHEAPIATRPRDHTSETSG